MNWGFKKSEILKAAIYTRVSTNSQAEKGYGLDAQLSKCQRTCELKDFEVTKIYTDEGVSGTIEPCKRKGFNEALEDAKAGKFKVLVFYAFDRLGRNINVFLDIVKKLKELKITILSCNENIDTNTDDGEFMLHIYASVAHHELKTIRSRLMNGREQKRLQSGYIGGKLPYGYHFNGGFLEVNPKQALIVNYIFTCHYEKKLSTRKIAMLLNDGKVETAKGGKIWRSSSIIPILDNRKKYSGCLINDNKNGVYWIPILDKEYPDRKS